MTIVRVALLAVALAIGTWLLGWWAVPLLGAAWGVLQRGRPRFLTAFGAAVLAWALLLALDAVPGSLGRLTTVLGGIFMMPGAVLVVVMLLYAGLLAGCAAQVSGAFAQR